jgi:hypothetical protein
MLIGYTCVSSSVFALLFDLLTNKNLFKKNELWKIYRLPHVFYAMWLVIILSWIPAFLSYYPGVFSYDMPMQTMEAVQGIAYYTKFQPPLHTMIWAVCLHLDKIIGLEAITIYAIIQMLVLSFALAKLIEYFIHKKVNNVLILFSILFVMINPLVAIFSFIAVKDVCFAICFIMTNIYLSKLIANPEEFLSRKINYIYLLLGILFSSMFRNNAIYAFIVVAIVYFVMFKMHRKRIAILFLLPIISYFLITNVVFSALGIQEGNSREMLSVPIQQISNVMATEHDDFSEELIEEVDRFIPYRTINYYNPRFADPVKLTFKSEEFNENKLDFIKLWWRLLKEYPDNYISAFLNLNIPYWYIDASVVDEHSNREYIETRNHISEEYEIELDSKMPGLYQIYERVAYGGLDNIIGISYLFSLSLPIWVMLFTICVLIVRRHYRGILLVLPSAIYWCTFLLGPVSNLRYVFPMIILYPLYLVLIFDSGKIIEN